MIDGLEILISVFTTKNNKEVISMTNDTFCKSTASNLPNNLDKHLTRQKCSQKLIVGKGLKKEESFLLRSPRELVDTYFLR